MASVETIAESSIREMVEEQRHRGPDATNLRRCGLSILGSNRLRIIDVRKVADQPLSNEDGTVWVVFNGEIYNFKELRARLHGRGHVFSTESDTEVLVHLYEEHGSDLLEHLRGMFAFVIWDERRKTLLVGRDRLGIKPVFYAHEGGTLTVASEARTLARNGRRKLSSEGLTGYLRLGWVPCPQTIFDGVYELPPGHLLEWEAGHFRIRRWWDPPSLGRQIGKGRDLGEALRDSVSRHLVADVPVGLFLSSGLDSAALAYLASKDGAELQTFTVAFDVGSDESPDAAEWARRLGLPHTTVRVSGQDILEDLHNFVSDLDQPSVDGLNTWVISQAVSGAGIRVALSGLGGDELFQGYSTFRRLPVLHRLGRLASFIPQHVRAGLSGIAERGSQRHMAARAVDAISRGGWAAAYASMRGVMGSNQLERLAPGRTDETLESLAVVESRDAVDTVLQLELRNYLPQQLLRDADVNSMAHSLEMRVPLLDDEVLKAAIGAPVDQQNREGKARLAAAVAPALLELAARPKQTFTLPLNSWLKGPLESIAREALDRLSEPDPGLNREELSLIWDRFLEGRVHWRTVWSLTTLGLWADSH